MPNRKMHALNPFIRQRQAQRNFRPVLTKFLSVNRLVSPQPAVTPHPSPMSTRNTAEPAPLCKAAQEIQDIANKLRIHALKMTTASNSGHPTSCSSAAEIMAVLFFNAMKHNPCEPKSPHNDRLILSKGHAAPLLYGLYAEAGLFPMKELMTYRKIDSNYEGHPTPRLEFVDVATGSLGQGLAIAAGMAWVGKYLDKASYRVYCILGDGECAEGSIWEAVSFAGTYELDNLCFVIDCNRLGQSGPTALGHCTGRYKERLTAFGCSAMEVDGHCVKSLYKGFLCAMKTKGKPTGIIARTFKGYKFLDIQDAVGYHGKPLTERSAELIEHLEAQLSNVGPTAAKPAPCIEDAPDVELGTVCMSSPPAYGEETVATRNAYGTALAKLAQAHPRVIALDGDVSNSTFSEKLKEVDPERFIECWIAEQLMVGVATGCACRNRAIVFCSSFAAFLTRAFDQIRMAAISQSNINVCGSHCGVSIGEDGGSQMGLEDLAMFRSIPNSTVFYPSDAVSCEYAVQLAANTPGVCYIRTGRPATPILYANDEVFEIGKAKIVKCNPEDKALIIAGGVTTHEAIKAAAAMEARGISVRVMDAFTVKPIDREGIIQNAEETGGKILVVEDHYQAGGLGEAVMAAVCEHKSITIRHLCIRELPRSGKGPELMSMFGIASENIINGLGRLVGESKQPVTCQ